MGRVKMEFEAKTRLPKGELVAGFSWPDPDQSARVRMFETELAWHKTALGRVTEERDSLRERYENQNTPGRSGYGEARSRVSEDMEREPEGGETDDEAVREALKEAGKTNPAEELIEEMESEQTEKAINAEVEGSIIDAMRDAAYDEVGVVMSTVMGRKLAREFGFTGSGRVKKALKRIGPPNGHRGHDRSTRPHCNVWHGLSGCAGCGGRHVRIGRVLLKLTHDFKDDRIWMRTIAHMGRPIKCLDCGRVTRPNLPGIRGTSFGRKALGFIVQLSGMKNVDADTARVFEDMFGFKTAATTVWNARKAAADMLEPTMRHIMEELKRAPFLGIDETHYSINGKKGYVWVVRTPTAVYILAPPTRSGTVLPTHFREILDRKVVADGYTVYAIYFKILQRCWAHILRDAEKAYLRSRRGSRRAYRALYRRLLGIFHDAKRIAGETADSGGAGTDVCFAMERRVMELVALYGSHKFGTTLANAAPHLFTFLWNAAQQQRDGAGHTRRGRPAAQDPPQVRQCNGQEGLLHTAELQHDLPQAGPRPVAVRGEDGGEPRLQHIRRRTRAGGSARPAGCGARTGQAIRGRHPR